MLTRNQKFVRDFGAWTFLVLAGLIIARSLDYQLFFLFDFIGLAIIIELTYPRLAMPSLRRRLNLVIFIGMLIFSAIVLNKTAQLMNISIPW